MSRVRGDFFDHLAEPGVAPAALAPSASSRRTIARSRPAALGLGGNPGEHLRVGLAGFHLASSASWLMPVKRKKWPSSGSYSVFPFLPAAEGAGLIEEAGRWM